MPQVEMRNEVRPHCTWPYNWDQTVHATWAERAWVPVESRGTSSRVTGNRRRLRAARLWGVGVAPAL